ncbi:MAG: hypothetical protein JWP75_940 [Frondihabitans sp.]|nr:hypothetical protein [Frondihabitans sp.]
MDVDETGWVPPRPTRAEGAPGRLSGPLPESMADFTTSRLSTETTWGVPRRRIPLARRVAFGYLALAVVIALVAVLGTVLQPVYGSMKPYGGTSFVDVRSRPTASGWSLDLARTFSRTAPARCLAFHADTVGRHREVVTATLPSPDSSAATAACGEDSPDTPGILTMLDPVTGAVVWKRDLSRDLDMTVSSLVWHASRVAGVVVVGVDGSLGDRLLSLDVDTGRTVSSAAVSQSDEVINFGVSGDLVLSVVPDSGGTLDTYYLRRVGDLSKTVWTGSLSSTIFPEMLPDRLIIPMPTETLTVDGVTGDESRWGADLWRNQGILVMGDQVLAVTVSLGVGVEASLLLYDSSGHRVWSTPAAAISALNVSRSCVLVSSSSTVTCHDKRTGVPRWTTSLNGQVNGTPDGSTTDDVVGTATVHEGATSLDVTVFDGATGQPRFTANIPRGADIVGEGTTTGYTLDSTSPAGMSTLMAFDLDSGLTLWSLTEPDLELWGGHLVQISANGVAQELTDDHSARSHAMLDG